MDQLDYSFLESPVFAIEDEYRIHEGAETEIEVAKTDGTKIIVKSRKPRLRDILRREPLEFDVTYKVLDPPTVEARDWLVEGRGTWTAVENDNPNSALIKEAEALIAEREPIMSPVKFKELQRLRKGQQKLSFTLPKGVRLTRDEISKLRTIVRNIATGDYVVAEAKVGL